MSNVTKEEKRLSFSIPTRSIWSVIILMWLGWFIYIQTIWYFIPSFKILWNLQTSDVAMIHLPLFWAPLILCLLVFLFFLFFIRIFKSLKNLKGWDTGLFATVKKFLIVTFLLFLGVFVSAAYRNNGQMLLMFRGILICLLLGLILGGVVGIIRELRPEK